MGWTRRLRGVKNKRWRDAAAYRTVVEKTGWKALSAPISVITPLLNPCKGFE
jgi:lipopolysaccharide biosynthesis protein